jgi:hypothetical protein
MSVTSAAAAHWQAADETPISPPVLFVIDNDALVHEYLEAEAADALEHGYSLPFLGKPVAGSLTWDQET